ncbi:hypothetical protein [Tahibacter soli]|uniref:Uncharacterized protein n=1 Tax=Tahibacter soli TaxID=2983605 RepID=A0A9X3YH70_9GAMM|nr:hypothetical protein [Tahibacter soli]MDC8010940.1 hypothetical protein [Tahibacter soli]
MKYLASGLVALFATSAWAHDPLPSANWCQNGLATNVASFAFAEADINAWVACVEAGNCPDPRPHAQTTPTPTCNSLKSCGNFDDDYGKAALMVVAHCDQYAEPVPGTTSVAGRPATSSPGQEFGSVAPIVYGPQFFLSTLHHARYKKSAGVQGVCAKCSPAIPVGNSPES